MTQHNPYPPGNQPPPIPPYTQPPPYGQPPPYAPVPPVLEYGHATAGAVPCPTCGDRRSKPVKWTLWGGALGPRMFSHVACLGCGAKYNGKTGRSNSTAIALYLIISSVIGIVAGVLIVMAMHR